MAELAKLLADLSIISLLDNEPNDIGGLSAEVLKAKFDEAANIIKDYINETLLPGLAGADGAENIGITAIPGVTGAENVQAALEKIETQMADMTQGAVADNSITTEKLVNSAVTAAKLAAGAVETAKIANGAVTGDKLAALAVETAALAELAVTSAKIANKAVIRRCIGDKAVGTAQIGDNAVGTEQIDALAVTAAKLAAGAVETAKIKAGAVTADKVNATSRTQYIPVTVSATWTGDAAPYTQTVTAQGITAADRPKMFYTPPESGEDVEATREAFALCYKLTSDEGSITVYALEKPETEFNATLEVSRI